MAQPAQIWPVSLIQPDRKVDCSYYSVAYLRHCFGQAEVTVEGVKAYRQKMRYQEIGYPEEVGITIDGYWHHKGKEFERFWLGAEQKAWVQEHLAQGDLAIVMGERVADMGHVVVLLEANETGVLLADPADGQVRETWEWFSGSGAGTHGCHRVQAWYRQ